MKAKLLRRLRETGEWKFLENSDAPFVLLQRGVITYHPSLEDMLFRWIEDNSHNYGGAFDWNWWGIGRDFKEKLAAREFRKIKR
jgi:hypothetical protein